MPLIFGIAAAAFFAMDTVWDLSFGVADGVTRYLFGFLRACLGGLVLAPLAIAIHRYVLLGEVGTSYSFNPSDRRLVRFVGAEIIYSAVFFAPLAAASIAMDTWKLSLPALGGVLSAIAVVIVIGIRLLMIFPAIAVDAPGASWGNALADSRGKTLRLFCTLVLAALVVLIPTYSLSVIIPTSHSMGWNIFSLAQSASHILYIAVTAAIVSLFFRVIGQRLKQP
jgi:hypothetical protein